MAIDNGSTIGTGPSYCTTSAYSCARATLMSMCAQRASSTNVSGWEMSKEGYLASAVSTTRANSWEAKGKVLGKDKCTHEV